jgi:hypothetical protein
VALPNAIAAHALPGVPCPRCHRTQLVAVVEGRRVVCVATFRMVKPASAGVGDHERVGLAEQLTRAAPDTATPGQDQLDERCGWAAGLDEWIAA